MTSFLFMIPHPDDEILACTYWLKYAINNRIPYKILFFTDGENDLTGEMLSFGAEHAYPLKEGSVSLSVKAVFHEKRIRKVYMIQVFDEKKQPVSGALLEICQGTRSRRLVTNELGWVCISTGDSLSAIRVDQEEVPVCAIVPVTKEFHRNYGELRFRESRRALMELGADERNMIRLHLRDGGLSALLEEQAESLKRSLWELLSKDPRGVVLLPHEKDMDEDHRAVSRIVQELAGDGHTLWKYLVHGKLDHKKWPEPAYVSRREDRLKGDRMENPLEEEPCAERWLKDVGLDREGKLALIRMFSTQLMADEFGFLYGFAKENELYYR